MKVVCAPKHVTEHTLTYSCVEKKCHFYFGTYAKLAEHAQGQWHGVPATLVHTFLEGPSSPLQQVPEHLRRDDFKQSAFTEFHVVPRRLEQLTDTFYNSIRYLCKEVC
jgi:hypothetical protein